MKKIIISVVGILFVVFLFKAGQIGLMIYKAKIGWKTFETVPPELNLDKKDFNVLLYSKANAWVHEEAIPAAKNTFMKLAEKNNWVLTVSDNGAIHNQEQLSLFDVVVWNNVTGQTLNERQRAAFKNYVGGGGGFVGFHGTGDDSHQWDWYYDELIRAVFSHHPMAPQFQTGTMNRESPESFPASDKLPLSLDREDEWYVFFESPRDKGAHILYTLDETDMIMSGTLENGLLKNKDFGMGDDHPVVWYNCVGKGKSFYSSLGHKASYYDEPYYQLLLTEAVNWAGNPEINCDL